MDLEPRRRAVQALVSSADNLSAAIVALSVFPWDCEESLVTVTAADAHAILRRYVDGGLSAVQVEAWADAVEVRDDIDFEGGSSGLVRECIHELANPSLEGELTEVVAAAWVDRLGSG